MTSHVLYDGMVAPVKGLIWKFIKKTYLQQAQKSKDDELLSIDLLNKDKVIVLDAVVIGIKTNLLFTQ